MNKKLFFLAIMAMVLVFGMAFVGCNKGPAGRLIGTWIDDGGDGWKFGSNGKLTFTDPDDNDEFPYVVADDKLTINFTGENSVVYDFSISSDGKTMELKVSTRTGRVPSWVRNYSFTKK